MSIEPSQLKPGKKIRGALSKEERRTIVKSGPKDSRVPVLNERLFRLTQEAYLDDDDMKAVIECLLEDPRMSCTEISRRTKVTRKRVERMIHQSMPFIKVTITPVSWEEYHVRVTGKTLNAIETELPIEPSSKAAKTVESPGSTGKFYNKKQRIEEDFKDFDDQEDAEGDNP